MPYMDVGMSERLKKPKTQHTKELRADAVRLVLNDEQPVERVAHNLSIHSVTVRRRVRKIAWRPIQLQTAWQYEHRRAWSAQTFASREPHPA